MPFLYSKEMVEHFKKPRNLGRIENADAVGEAGNILCGDIMRIYLKIGENRKGEKIIKDIKGEVFGCLVAIANTSALTTMAKGKRVEEVLKIKKEELIKKLGGKEKIPAFKLHCSLLALDALHEAIYNYYLKNKLPIPKELKKEHQRIRRTLTEIEHRYKKFVEMERSFTLPSSPR